MIYIILRNYSNRRDADGCKKNDSSSSETVDTFVRNKEDISESQYCTVIISYLHLDCIVEITYEVTFVERTIGHLFIYAKFNSYVAVTLFSGNSF